MSTGNDRSQNIQDEILRVESNPWIKRDHFLMKWPFAHPARNDYAWKTCRLNARKVLSDHLMKTGSRAGKMLIAPCGTGADQDILEGLAEKYFGIDICKKVVDKCPPGIEKKVGDIRDSGYESEHFDVVASFLFFHHLHRCGFDPFLAEFFRVLKKGGLLFIMEPGNLYPIHWVTYAGRKVFGNITGSVPDERPVFPPALTRSIKRCGFGIQLIRCVSFSHVRLPVPLQKALDFLSNPLRKIPLLNQGGSIILWICRKQAAPRHQG